LIVPLRSDQKLVDNAARAYYERVLESGASIYLFDQGLLHAKSMTIDDSLAFLGSSNFDIRSFALNFEINVIFMVRNSLTNCASSKKVFATTPGRFPSRSGGNGPATRESRRTSLNC